jgi:O-glycosyl hydrolase
LALNVTFEELSVRCATLRSETLAFGWEGPLRRNDKEQPITGFKHYDNPYCVADLPASQLEVRYGDQAMRLNFATSTLSMIN